MDLINVMKVQGPALDQPYLQKWARELELAELLAKAEREALGVGA